METGRRHPGEGEGEGGGEGPGGGGQLQYEMPGRVGWGSENVPIMKDSLGQKTYPYWRDPLQYLYPHYGVIFY